MMSCHDDKAVCINCIEDEWLRKHVEDANHNHVCVVCKNTGVAIPIDDLAKFIEPFIREHYQQGSYERRWSLEEDDSYWEEQNGEDLHFVIQEIVGQDFTFEEDLINALIEQDPGNWSHDEESFFSLEANYVQTKTYSNHLFEQWHRIGDELKTKRRFFSVKAREFFDFLFEDIEDLWFYGDENSDEVSLKPLKKTGVTQELPIGIELYRARRADTHLDYTQQVLNPAKELAPPPSKYARAGRMNAAGVTIFYAALEAETCLAEMRSSIGGHIVLGRFETITTLRILDFTRLEKALWSHKQLSYFQEDFQNQIIRRNFLRRIHKLISEPVIPGHEDEYIMTQVLAEYLAYVRTPNFDGLLFASTQHKNGSNIVLFPKSTKSILDFSDLMQVQDKGTLEVFPLRYVDQSAEIYRTEGINYDIAKIDFSINENNELHLKKPYYYDDEY